MASNGSEEIELFRRFDSFSECGDAEVSPELRDSTKDRHRLTVFGCCRYEASVDLDPVKREIPKMRQR